MLVVGSHVHSIVFNFYVTNIDYVKYKYSHRNIPGSHFTYSFVVVVNVVLLKKWSFGDKDFQEKWSV